MSEVVADQSFVDYDRTGVTMHPYATDSHEARLIPLALAVISIVVAWTFYGVLGAFRITVPWWLDAPSVIALYGACYKLYDEWFWTWALLRKLGVARHPNLSGQWDGELTSSFDSGAKRVPATISVKQTWTHICVHLKTATSQSYSTAAAIAISQPTGPTLTYQYFNEPKASPNTTGMHIHRGTAWQVFIEANGLETLDGEYYTGRDRGNYGSLTFRRPAAKLTASATVAPSAPVTAR
jgi:hypothetical protein